MNKYKWREIVRKTTWASGKKRLNKQELRELLDNAVILERFMAGNKSDYAGAERSEGLVDKRKNLSPPSPGVMK